LIQRIRGLQSALETREEAYERQLARQERQERWRSEAARDERVRKNEATYQRSVAAQRLETARERGDERGERAALEELRRWSDA
jgi:hypothetical protein